VTGNGGVSFGRMYLDAGGGDEREEVSPEMPFVSSAGLFYRYDSES